MERVLITGGAGFIGSHLADALLERGTPVRVLDNFTMGRRENLARHAGHSRLEVVEADVQDAAAVAAAARGCGAIAHLAAFKIPRYGGRLATLEVNSRGMRSVLEAARAVSARVLLASTSDCYGANPELPFSEESFSCLGPSTVPRWSYAVSKLFDEHLCLAYREEYGLPVTILRFFSTYGPRHHLSWWGGPQAVFIEAMLDGREVELHGDGSQTRSFCYVSDTVSGIVSALDRAEADGEVLNLGSEREIRIVDLARMIQRLCGLEGPLRARLVPYDRLGAGRYQDVSRRVPDLSRARRILGYEPGVSLEAGLERTIAWHRGLRVAAATPVGAAAAG